MAGQVEVREVEAGPDFKAFFEFPWVLYRDDPNWVPPLKSMRRDLLDKQKNPGWEYMEGQYFGAWRGEKLVGTITALINHRHNEFHNEHIGWFGTFEVYDDQEAATALLNTAANWVQARGYDAIRGPQSFATHDETGLLVENFSRPVLLMPYNFPYYEGLIVNAGFEKKMDIYSFYLDREMIDDSTHKRIARLSNAVMRRSKITVRGMDRKNLDAEFTLFKEIYNAAWVQNWGFVPMTERELDAMVESLGDFVDPDLAFFGYVDGDPAGFIMTVPDFNQVLLAANPRPGIPEPLTLLRALWHWKVRPAMDWVRIPLLGVKAEYREKGVDVALYFKLNQALIPTHYQHADAGWVLETNEAMLGILDTFGAKRYKTYRFYERNWKGH